MKNVLFLLPLLFVGLSISFKTFAQADFYNSETIFGVNFNSNGGLIGGIMFRNTRALQTDGRYIHFGLEAAYVKHPNETRYPNNLTGNIFVLGKKNYFFSLRPSVGYELHLFSKGKEDGVQVNAILNGGPSIGILKPYFIQYDNGTTIEIVPYDPVKHDPSTLGGGIIGSGGFFYGLDQLSIVPGLHAKAGLSFEFGAWGSGVSGLEVGTQIEVFTKRIELLDISSSFPTYNRSLFSSLYVNLYFGTRR